MTDKRTIDTYNKSAKQLAEYFRGIGPRKKYIDYAFEKAGNPEAARVVEIGCGDGRDAKAITERAGWYLGIDPSKELIKMAKAHVPNAKFVVGDAATYKYPSNIDIVFSFASILHLDKGELRATLSKISDALKPGGVLYISSKFRESFESGIKKDKYGERLFYFYNPDLVKELAGDKYELIDTWKETVGHTEWFEIALRRI